MPAAADDDEQWGPAMAMLLRSVTGWSSAFGPIEVLFLFRPSLLPRQHPDMFPRSLIFGLLLA
ncbi:MAG: hypothetical protein QF412_10250, partial [Planctomycetota bacterium]|nr:hypothetical protein [Planctomycetota bacterium]